MIERLIALKSRALAWLLGVPLAPRVVAPPGYSVQACNAVGYSPPARTWRADALPRRVFVEDLGHRTRRAARWYRIFRDVDGRPTLVREVVASGDRLDIFDVPDAAPSGFVPEDLDPMLGWVGGSGHMTLIGRRSAAARPVRRPRLRGPWRPPSGGMVWTAEDLDLLRCIPGTPVDSPGALPGKAATDGDQP